MTLTYVNAFRYFFGRNVTDKVSNQKTLYCATQNNLCFCTTWQNGETRKSHYFIQMLGRCIAKIQLVAPWFLQSFWPTTHTHAAVWLPESCNHCIQFGDAGGMVQEKGIESAATVGLCCTHSACAPMCRFPERKKCHLWCVSIASDICWDSTYPINTVH